MVYLNILCCYYCIINITLLSLFECSYRFSYFPPSYYPGLGLCFLFKSLLLLLLPHAFCVVSLPVFHLTWSQIGRALQKGLILCLAIPMVVASFSIGARFQSLPVSLTKLYSACFVSSPSLISFHVDNLTCQFSSSFSSPISSSSLFSSLHPCLPSKLLYVLSGLMSG